MWRVCLHWLVAWSVVPISWVSGDIEFDPGVIIQVSPATVIAQKTFPFLLNCSAYTTAEYRPANYTWYKDGHPVVLDKRVQLGNNGSLQFSRIKRRKRKKKVNDQGFYECFLTNSEGTVIGRQVNLKIARIAKTFKLEPQDVSITTGGVARFECDIDSVPIPRYIWKKDGNTIPRGQRFTELSSGILQIDNVQLSDAGNYYCSAHQSFTSLVTQGQVAISSPIWRHSNEATLTVLPASGNRAPSIVSATKVINATIDTTVLLECFADGYPKPTITWQKKVGGGKPDTPVLEDVHKRRIGNGNLKFIEVSDIDEGVYKCTASVPGFDDAVAEIRLNVLEPPKIFDKPVSSAYALAQRVRLPCKVKGKPKPRVRWYKNGKLIHSNGHIKISDSNELLIESRRTDSGYYQCFATNAAGSDMATARLKITLRENAPQPPQQVRATALSSTVIKVTWLPSVVPDCCPVIGYTVHYNMVTNNTEGEDLDLKLLSQSTSLEVRDLHPYTKYKFYVLAYSTAGASQGLAPVTATTLEGIPSAAPSVNLSSPSPTSLDVKWSPLKERHRNGVITKYIVVYKEEGKGKVEQRKEVPAKTHHYVITGLKPDKEYSVRVLAATSRGYHNLTDKRWPWAYQRTMPNSTHELPTPKLEIQLLNRSVVKVSWEVKNTSKPIKTFRLYVRPLIGHSSAVDVYEVGPTEKSFTITGLDSKMFYEVILMVQGHEKTLGIADKWFQALDPGSPPEPPPPPEIETMAITSSTMLVEWRRPRVNMQISHYTVKYHKSDDIQNVNYIRSDGISVVLSNLQAFTKYTISVRSHTQWNYGPFSNAVIETTKEDVPDAPQDIQLVPLKEGMVKLSWKPPVRQNGVIIFYVIQYNKEFTVQDELWKSLQKNGTKTTAVVGDLTSTVYYFRVRACTKAGLGPFSGVAQVKLTCPVNCDQPIAPDSDITTYQGSSPLKDQRIGIIIGCTIGLSSIAICILVIILRQRHYSNLYMQQTGQQTLTTANSNTYAGVCYPSHCGHRMANYSSADPSTPMLRESIHFDSKGTGPDVLIHRNGQVVYMCNGTTPAQTLQSITESSPLMSSHNSHERNEVDNEGSRRENSLFSSVDDVMATVAMDSKQSGAKTVDNSENDKCHKTSSADMDNLRNRDMEEKTENCSEKLTSDRELHNKSGMQDSTGNIHSSYSGNDLLSKMLEATSSDVCIQSSVSSPQLNSQIQKNQKKSGLSYGSSSFGSSLPQKSRSKAQKRSC